ncbi:alkaline phosphatase [Cesiribacter sp. SM1]|uniref:alkaline phosphatase n=1 Tax=Cesiribacter sp. SM1 TaxID=2861196 RepID=UPI001CD4AFCD|nr:alkaline phosphatase [Cesiribacter sp. SM1]
MKKLLIFCITIFVSALATAQVYTASNIFAHNDYVQPVPFYTAYVQEVGYLEADIFLQGKELYVAHTREEIEKDKTLEGLYLKPLQKYISANKGFVYADSGKTLTLMIDLKTEGASTLTQLVKILKKYPQLLASPSLKITISGNTPEPATWKEYPYFIYFDGRPGIAYTPEQLERISLISTSFREYTQWNGKGVLPKEEKRTLQALINDVHAKGKKIRFWASPDFGNAWIQLMNMQVDVLNTDNVPRLAAFLKDLPKNTYQHTSPHAVYKPSVAHSSQKSGPRNIILMIGDGMGLTQLYSGYAANRGQLNIFNIKDIGFSITTATDSDITDSAAGATAMASGSKTNNRHVGVDSLGNPLVPITEKLKSRGFSTAIISNGDVTDATPAAFYAHQAERSLSEAIAYDYLSSNNDILIGAGAGAFKNRKDGKNLLQELRQKGYFVSESFSAIDSVQGNKVLILDGANALSKQQGRGDFLPSALVKSLQLLSHKPKPFFVMAEGAQIDWGGHSNDMGYVVREVLDFDQAIGEAMKFVDSDGETLLLITADHETGGLSLLGGDVSKGSIHGHFSTTDHTGVMVPVFAYGPGSEAFRGVYQNTELHWKIMELLKVLQEQN